MHIADAVISDVLEDWTQADIPEDLRAGLRLCEAMTKHPQDIDRAFVDELRVLVDDPRLQEAAGVAFHYNFINRVADAFDFPIPDAKGQRTLAKALNTMGRIISSPRPTPFIGRGADGVLRPVDLEAGRARMLSTPGHSDVAVRASVEAFVKQQWNMPTPEAAPLPPELASYFSKLALRAYTIVDEDVEALTSAGYDNEAIYELTIVGAFAAALVGLEALTSAMHGQGDAPSGAG